MARIEGTSGDDALIQGTDQKDSIATGSGNDLVRAGDGDDWIYGNWETQIVYGQGGADDMWGYAARDVFAYEAASDSPNTNKGRDTIMDFGFGGTADSIDLSALGLDPSDVSIVETHKGWRVLADVNGDGVADLGIDVLGVAPTFGDLIL